MRFCSQCGASNADDASFCEKCGNAIASEQPAAGVTAQPIAEQAKVALSTASSAAKKISPVAIAAAVVVLVLLGVGIAITRPMDEREYKKEAENQAEDMLTAGSRVYGAIYDMVYDYEDAGDDVDSGNVQDAREAYEKQSQRVKKAAAAINSLRPPSDYKDADQDLRTWASWTSGDGLSMVDELIAQAEKDGMTYEDLQDVMSDFEEEYQDAGEDANEALEDAVDDLNISPYPEGE